MLTIRLQRKGTRRKPQHAIVVMEHRQPTDGRALEYVGTYNPLQDPPAVTVKQERIDYWVQHGARMSSSVSSILQSHAHASKA